MIKRSIVPFALLIFGIYYFCIRILGPDLQYIPGDLGDSRFINYLLEHGYSFLKGDVDSFWNAPFMYPYKNVTALSDNLLGTMPIYALFRYFHFSIETAYQLWWISICMLNYLCAFFVLKKFTNHIILSAAFAYVFAFGFFNINHLNYMQMIIRFNVPLVIYCAYKLIESPKKKYLAGYIFALVFQFYCVMYTGFFLLYTSLIFMYFFIRSTKNKSSLKFYFKKENLRSSCLILIAGALLMCILMYPYLITAYNLGVRSYQEVAPNLPTIGSYFFSSESSYVWRFLFNPKIVPHENWWLQNIFAGIIPLLCFLVPLVFLIVKRRRENSDNFLLQSLIVTASITFLLFTRTEGGLTLYRLFFHLPGMNSIKVPTRFVHVQLFVVILAGALFFVRQNKWLIYSLALLGIIDNLFDPTKIVRTSKAEIQEHKSTLVEKIKSYDYKSYKALAYLPDSVPFYIAQIDMMLASQQLKVKCVNGYSSACPGEFGLMFFNCNKEGLEKWLKFNQIEKEDILVIK